jgi:hypothetical protein
MIHLFGVMPVKTGIQKPFKPGFRVELASA